MDNITLTSSNTIKDTNPKMSKIHFGLLIIVIVILMIIVYNEGNKSGKYEIEDTYYMPDESQNSLLWI